MNPNKVVISLAPVRATAATNADRLAEDVEKSVRAGAAMCHLHCRKKNGSLTADSDYMIECFEKIRARCDVVVQASTGGVSALTIEERCLPLQYERVETASLNAGSTNLGEAVYINSFADIRYCAKAVYEQSVIPEIEVFDIGMIHNITTIAREIPFRAPLLLNLVFGHLGGMPATPESLVSFRSFVPADALWGVTHFGRDNWHFLAAAIALGAHIVRIGFEDSAYLDPGRAATENYQLVEKLTRLIREMGFDTATPPEARKIMKTLKA